MRYPPRYFNVDSKARFRKHRLPRALYYTWETMRAMAWMNNYEFTTPLTNETLAREVGIEPRALQEHTTRLRAWGWIEKISAARHGNVYHLSVPADTADSIGSTDSIVSRELGTDSSADSGELNDGSESGEEGCKKMHPSDAISTAAVAVVLSACPNLEKQQQQQNITRAREERATLLALITRLGIGSPEDERLCDLPHVEEDYLRRMVEFAQHDRDGKERLPGWYVLRLRENWQPPAARRRRWWSDDYDQFILR